MDVKFDAKEIESLGRSIAALPGEIKTKAMARAMRRIRDMAKTRIVRTTAARTDLTRQMVAEKTTARFNAGGNTIDVIEKSGWISLYKLGAVQTKVGVSTKLRGSYKQAFIGAMASGHKGVMIRDLADGEGPGGRRVKRLGITELFGPNPAHDVTNNPDEYLQVVAELIEEALLPRVLHEIERLLPKGS
jgi:hypothetical protein